jgi:predicted GNAT family acetyltransferase
MDSNSLIAFIDETCNETNSRFVSSGEVEPLGIDGITGRISNLDSFALNCVGVSKLSEQTAENTIREVIESYKKEAKNFTWLVGPSSSPHNLGSLLEKNGLIKIPQTCMSGMYIELKEFKLKGNEEVLIEKKSISKILEYSDLLASTRGFGESVEAHTLRSKLIIHSGDGGDLYLAFLENRDNPVAYGVSVYYKKEKIVILQGSGTLGALRGKGIYTSLVAARIADANAMGMETAVIQAIKSTSMPICQKMGFIKISDIDSYAYGQANLDHTKRVISTL